jgi:hypothetical protein
VAFPARRRWALREEEVRPLDRLWRATKDVLVVLALAIAVLNALAQLGEALLCVLKAWRSLLF